MKNRRRSKLGIFGGLLALLGASFLPASPAQADVLPNNPIINDYSSDPDARKCTIGGYQGICLYTSRDDRPSNWDYNNNPYPMTVTRMYFLRNGLNPGTQSNWQPVGSTVNVDGTNVGGVVLRENQLPNVPSNARHLWAPTGWFSPYQNRYFLLVPDVLNANQTATSSRIFVFKSTSASNAGSYQFHAMLQDNSSYAPNNGYLSDPSISPSSQDGYLPYFVYANGDYSNCGKISFGKMAQSMLGMGGQGREVVPKHLAVNGAVPQGVPGTAVVHMTGVPSNMKGCNNNNDYYMEGPEHFTRTVYGQTKHYLVFAMKPAQGNSVIAYAMANSFYGPYEYKGVIMNGSSTEWTNQATIVQDAGPRGMSYFFYHDGASGSPHSRKVHAECFRFNANGTIPTINRTTSTSSSSWIGNCWND